jgi:predicted nuclease with TOPRIM domain
MKEQIQSRLEELKREYETGQARLRELESETAYVRETMLRISGAIQVIQELLEKHEQQDEAVEPVQAGQVDS